MNAQVIAIGTLRSFEFEYKGQSNFPVGKLAVSLGQDFLQFDVTGPMAEATNAMLGSATGEPRLQVNGKLSFRQNADSGEIYSSLELTGVAPSNNPNLGAVFQMTGIIGEMLEKQGRSGTFKIPVLNLISADRTAVIPAAPVELSFTRADEEVQKAAWTNGYGLLGEITGQVTAFVSQSGRAYPKFRAETINVTALPEYLEPFSPLAAAGATDPAALAAAAAAPAGAMI